ncbi:MAG: hypothetical protein HN948_01385 [Clostridia bacterium]|jgi:hypothetical protein|nr:hypothetical protein [Clostridia bacterium]MBT7121642.1 hypothetical protein [Clostridia bacterium]
MQKIDWASDLEQLKSQLPALHKKTFSSQEKASFSAQIDKLILRLNSLDTYHIATQIARIVATIGDAHTTAVLPRHSRLPLECYWFKEGIYITLTVPELAHLRQKRIVAIEGIPIDEIVDRLSQVISFENQSFLMSALPAYLVCADILFGIGVLSGSRNAKLTLESTDKQQQVVGICTTLYEGFQPSAMTAAMNAVVLPLYRRNRDKHYWSELNGESLYFNYNRCADMDEISVSDFTAKLIADIKANPRISKLVIDLRNNGGGNSELLRGFLEWLTTFYRLNVQGSLFVIVGRDTFSSALLNTFFLAQHTQATFVGEPTGGKPNSFGEVKYLSLGSSGMLIRYSTNYYELIDDDKQSSFIPDILFDVNFRDFAAGIDPCVDWIAKQ